MRYPVVKLRTRSGHHIQWSNYHSESCGQTDHSSGQTDHSGLTTPKLTTVPPDPDLRARSGRGNHTMTPSDYMSEGAPRRTEQRATKPPLLCTRPSQKDNRKTARPEPPRAAWQ